MADIKTKFGSLVTMSSTACIMLTAGSAIGWESSAVDNSGNLYQDALIQFSISFGASAPAGDKALYIYAYGAMSSTFSSPITGSQGLVTAGNALTGTNIRPLYVMTLGTASQTLISPPISVNTTFGGVLPPKWGIFILNDAGSTLLTAAAVAIKWKGVYYTAV